MNSSLPSVPTGRLDLVPLAILSGGFFLLLFFLIGRHIAQKRAVKNLPLTGINILRHSETLLPALPGFAAFGESTHSIQLCLATEARRAAIIVGAFTLIATGIAWGCFYRVMQDARFAKEGEIAVATVQATDISVSGKGRNRIYRVRYGFVVGGQNYEGSGDLPTHKSLRNAQRTQQVSIRYLASDPRINRPSETRPLPIAIAIVAPLILFLPLAIFAHVLRRDRELLTKGSLAAGQVIGITSGRRYSWRYYYDFADSIGQVRRGSSRLQKYSVTNVGSPVHVFYLPEDPERNSLYLALFWRV